MADGKGLVAVLEVAIREMVREELRAALQEASLGARAQEGASRWTTPPKAAAALAIPVKTIRQMIRDGRITPRLRNSSGSPRQSKFLVNLDDVGAAARGVSAVVHKEDEPTSLAARAARIRAKDEGR